MRPRISDFISVFTASTIVAFIAASSADSHAQAASEGARSQHPTSIRLTPELQLLAAEAPAAGKALLRAPWRKVSRSLRERLASLQARGLTEASQVPPDLDSLRGGALRLREDGAILVSLRVSGTGRSELARLRAVGFEPTFESARFLLVEGWLSIFRLESVARLGFVNSVHPAVPPRTSAGSVLTEGDAILFADQARLNLGVSGAGVTVGVISDSVDGMAASQASGDLPSQIQVLKAGAGAGEGTAMLEIVHDLAPGAELGFYGPASSGDMITGINRLAAAGASVIVDDLTFFDQPHFEEGPVAQTINSVAAQGVVYVTASGNDAQASGSGSGHYEANFAGGGSLGGPTQDVHLFVPCPVCNAFQSITVLPGKVGVVILQWADKFGAAGDDYDLYITDVNRTIIAMSDDVQDGNDDPIEMVFLDNKASSFPATIRVVVDRFAGSPRRIKVFYFEITDIEFGSAVGSIAGHANASGAITVGTINADDPGNDDIAPYSSQGPCDLFFPAVVARQKPDVTGIDGVSVTGAAGFSNPFFGTSAAAPHVAAVAALMLEADPSLPAARVKEILGETAVDLGASGGDTVFGSGRVDAEFAVALTVFCTDSTTCGVGACERTVENCVGGTIQTCTPGAPSAETCDGVDNDCNGDVDDAIAPLASTCGVGACAATGQKTCVGGQFVDSCQPGTPISEVCDGLDNNCNGQPDEGLGTSSCGVGACQRTVQNCLGAGTQVCTPGAPTAEICDGLDNDCTGQTDDGLGSSSCGVGACQRTVQNCVGGATQTCIAGVPSVETCDLADNNCNGIVDEGIAPVATSCGIGACAASGQGTCVGGQLVDTCHASSPMSEVCDAIDNNCNGFVDDAIGGCTLFVTAPLAGGVLDCTSPSTLQPTITWNNAQYDKFKVSIGTNSAFTKGTFVTSGKAISTSSWHATVKAWSKICAKAVDGGTLFLRIQGIDTNVPNSNPLKKFFSPIVQVSANK